MMNRKQLLRKLQMLDFAIQETALFLNSHPDDRQAMQYYQSAVKEREKVAKDLWPLRAAIRPSPALSGRAGSRR